MCLRVSSTTLMVIPSTTIIQGPKSLLWSSSTFSIISFPVFLYTAIIGVNTRNMRNISKIFVQNPMIDILDVLLNTTIARILDCFPQSFPLLHRLRQWSLTSIRLFCLQPSKRLEKVNLCERCTFLLVVLSSGVFYSSETISSWCMHGKRMNKFSMKRTESRKTCFCTLIFKNENTKIIALRLTPVCVACTKNLDGCERALQRGCRGQTAVCLYLDTFVYYDVEFFVYLKQT